MPADRSLVLNLAVLSAIAGAVCAWKYRDLRDRLEVLEVVLFEEEEQKTEEIDREVWG